MKIDYLVFGRLLTFCLCRFFVLIHSPKNNLITNQLIKVKYFTSAMLICCYKVTLNSPPYYWSASNCKILKMPKKLFYVIYSFVKYDVLNKNNVYCYLNVNFL